MPTKSDLAALMQLPDERGHFGPYGGRFVSETLMGALQDLERVYEKLSKDAEFQKEFDRDLAHYVGRPSPLYFAVQRFILNVKISIIPVLIKLITPLVRLYWLSLWVNHALSQKQAQGSMVLRLQRLLLVWGLNVKCIWVLMMCIVNR